MGLIVRHIQLEPDGHETELYAVAVPLAVEAAGGAAIDAYVAAELAERAAATTSSPPTEADVTAGGC